jgi:alpha-beta hydrolase superfamily lysophospholipase
MRAVHRRGGALKMLPLAAAIGAILAVTAVAILLMRQQAPSGENGTGPIDPNAIQFSSEDGWTLRGVYYRENQSMPLVVLVPGVNEGRKAFGPLVDELRARGYNVLAYDPRGVGESIYQNGRRRVWQDFTDADFQAGTMDVASAWRWALANSITAPKVAVIGASLGANQALASAAAISAPELRTLVLLSPGSTYRGIESRPAIETLNNRTVRPAIFFGASDKEPTAGAVAQSLNMSYAGARHLSILGNDSRHGSQLVTDPPFRAEMIRFLDDTSGA